MNKRCENTCKAVHQHIRPLLSRIHEQNANEASYRTFLGIIKHAARLAIAMNENGGPEAWFIDFPTCHEVFKAEFMEDVEKFSKNDGAVGTAERDGQILVKMAAAPLVMRAKRGEQPMVIYAARVLCVY